MKTQILPTFLGWIKTRWLGLAIGFVLYWLAWNESDTLFAFIGTLILLQTFFGKGCLCGATSCER